MNNNTVKETKVVETVPAGAVQTNTVSSTASPMSDFFVSKTNQIIFTIIAIINLLIFFRFLFLLLGANRVGIVSFILDITYPFVVPFMGIFPTPASGASYVELASLLAIAMWIVLGFIVASLINIFSSRTDTTV